VALTDEHGSVEARYHYDAWGAFIFLDDLNDSANRFAFTGHIWDEEPGLYHAKARYLDPKLGRFLTQDSHLGKVNEPPSLHRYAYANGNPTRYVDRDGHSATAAGAAIGAVWGVGQSIGGFIDDTTQGKTRSAGEYFSVIAQNTIAGAEIGLAIDIGLRGGGLAAAPAGALMGAGISGLTFQGRAQEWSGFVVNQGKGAAIGATLAAAPMLVIPAAAYGVYTGIQETRSGAPEVGATTIALSVVPFAFKGVRDMALGRKSAAPVAAPPAVSNGKPAMLAEASGQGAASTGMRPAVESAPVPVAASQPARESSGRVFYGTPQGDLIVGPPELPVNARGGRVVVPLGHRMSAFDPPLPADPIIRRGPFTTAQRDAFLRGSPGDTHLAPHHRGQVPVEHGGVIDELPGPGSALGNVHTGQPRHVNPSTFNRMQRGGSLRSAETRIHWREKGARLVEVEPGVWIDPQGN
jgi:RHS repeat-associated protein